MGAPVGLGQRGKSQSGRWAEESRRRAREGGELPHEFLLRLSRGEPIDYVTLQEDGSLKEMTYYPTIGDRVEAAQSCANYFAPKLVAQQVENMDPLQDMSDEDIDRKLAEFEKNSASQEA